MSEQKPIEKNIQDIFNGIRDAVVSYDINASIRWCRKAVEENIDVLDAMLLGLSEGMDKVKELYANKEYYIPELLLCSDALYAGLDVLKPHIENNTAVQGRKMLIGVVEGDIHDIGKNIVKAMFIAKGWDVYDLGCDVSPGRFLEEQQRTGAELVALSALMTTSMNTMSEVISMIRAYNSNVRIIVGGAPLSVEIADKFGADGYAPDASTAVEKADNLFNIFV